MFYLGILLTIFLIGSIALVARLKQSLPSKSSTEVLLKHCSEAIANKHWEQALALISPLTQCDFGGSEAHQLHAHILRSVHLPEKALQQACQGLKKDKKNLSLLLEKGKALFDLGHFQKALDSLGQCLPIMQNEADHLHFACTLFQLGYLSDAWKLISPHIKTSKSGRLFALAGDLLFAKQKYIEAARYYFLAKHSGWCGHHVTIRLGYALLGANCLDAAEKYFQEILDKDQGNIAATLGIGGILENTRDIEGALEVYQKEEAWNKADPHLLKQAGFCAIKTRRYHHAEIYLTAAKEQGYLSPKLLTLLAYSQEAQNRHAEAEKTFLDLVQCFPKHPSGYRGLAWLCGIGKNTLLTPFDGITMAKKAIDLLPGSTSWDLLSACEARAGNFDNAHLIQETLEAREEDSADRKRHRRAMRILRKGQTLEVHLMRPSMVA